MIETYLAITNNRYPFGEGGFDQQGIKVQDCQTFTCLKSLQEKKNEMMKKNELISSPSLIQLERVCHEDMQLHFIYEYIPLSLSLLIEMKSKGQNREMAEMAKKLFLKKMSYDLTILISYLIKMKIQLDLSPQNIGFNREERLKVFMSCKCRMGHKTQLSLISYYSQCKEKILTFIQGQFNIESNPTNFKIHGNKLVFENPNYRQSLHESVLSSRISYNTEKSKCGEKKGKNIERKLSCNNFQECKWLAEKQKESRRHKMSFQSNHDDTKSEKTFFNSPGFNSNQDPVITQSKSIKIEFEQKKNPKEEKHRKDSYKLKITTYREYDLDNCGDPYTFFNPEGTSEDDIFDYFAKKSQNQADVNRKNSDQQPTESTINASSFLPTETNISHSMSSKSIEKKVREAKERAERVLQKMKNLKK